MRALYAKGKSRSLIVGPAALALLLSACDRSETAPAPEPDEPVETEAPPAPEAEVPTHSILRNDIDSPPAEEPPPEPLELTVPFGEGGTALSEAAKAVIAEIAGSEQFAGDGAIVLRGHTDSSGHDEANLRASTRRAQAVADALEEIGANPERISIIPMGEQNPVAPNANPDGTPSEDGRAANRRVEVTVEPPAEAAKAPDDASAGDEAAPAPNATTGAEEGS